jgi:hypothetical protein
MRRCASPLSNFPPEGERAIVSSPASGRGERSEGPRRGGATGAGMTASHLLPQSAGFAGNVPARSRPMVCSDPFAMSEVRS